MAKASLFDKVQTLIAANLHALVDKALQSNSIAVLDQYVRQVENSLDELEDAVATVGGQLKTLQRKQADFEAKADELDKNVDALLVDGKQELAAAAQSKLNSTRSLADSYKDQAEKQAAEYEKLQDARMKLEARLSTVKQEREELANLLELAKTKELTVKTVQSLDDLAGARDSDVARVAENIRSRLDQAQARSDMVASRLDNQMDDVLEHHQLDSQLDERRRRLGLTQ
jgi:phage shock protein A